MKEKEMWMQKLKEKLDDYSEPIPLSGWERLEKELIPPAEKRIIPYRHRLMVAAAAVLLAAVSSVSLYLLNTPVADDIRHTSVPTLATAPDREPVSIGATAPNRIMAKSDRKMEVLPTINDAEQKETELPVVESSTTESPVTETVVAEQPPKKEVRRPSKKKKLQLPEEQAVAQRSRWSIGASVGNVGGLSADVDPSGSQSASRMQMDMASSPNGVVKVPEGQTVVFKDGVPYLQNVKTVTSITHHQPVSFGLSLRKELKKGFSVETGVTYTLLSSDVNMEGNRAEKQKLHYVGIPVRANWSFVQKKLVTFYVSAGGAVEKCVYGELANERQTVKPLQFSLNGAVGAQINATDRLGFYIEPGVSYFFDDGSAIQTIRKETPCNFNLQAGVRFTY